MSKVRCWCGLTCNHRPGGSLLYRCLDALIPPPSTGLPPRPVAPETNVVMAATGDGVAHVGVTD